EMLSGYREHGYTRGRIDNSGAYMAVPMVGHLRLYRHTAITVGDDTTPHAEPHPAPLLHAAEKTGFAPGDAIYIGHDQRDIVAGQAAGMATVVAAYGYCGNDTALNSWNATAIAEQPEQLWGVIESWARG